MINGGVLDVGVIGKINTLDAGRGNGGTVSVIVGDALTISGINSGIYGHIGTGVIGKGGNIDINTGSLSVINGAQIDTSTDGHGNAGNITITATNAVAFYGISNGTFSLLFSGVDPDAIGNSGNINITASSLSLTNGSQINSISFGQGNAGNINITAKNAVTFNGVSEETPSGLYSGVAVGAIGNGGKINITASSLSLTNGAEIGSSNDETGDAGKLTVAANSINLDNGQLRANSSSGLGGNIDLEVRDLILIRHNSLISNTSGTTQNPGKEGELTINTKFLIAAPLENNDILTNAFSGSGGKINITATEGLFGFVVHNGNYSLDDLKLLQKNLFNDIAASSNSGIPNIDTRNTNVTSALIAPPIQLADVTSKFSQLCPNTANPKKKPLGSFVITGRGSIPPNPLELLPGRNPDIPLANAEDMQEIKAIQAQEQKKKEEQEHNTKLGRKKNKDNTLPSIVEAQGIVQTPDGQIYFVANANHATPSSQPTASPCPSQN